MARMRKSQDMLAVAAAWCVVALQVAMVVTFMVDRSDPPRVGSLWQALWALSHKPSFYPLVGVVLIGPPATYLAWTRRGAQRWAVAIAWAVFIPAAYVFFSHRIAVMLRLLYEHGGV